MIYDTLRYEVKDAISDDHARSSREAYNAIDLKLGRELLKAALAADEDQSVRCIIMTGAGAAFCAGGDVKALASPATA